MVLWRTRGIWPTQMSHYYTVKHGASSHSPIHPHSGGIMHRFALLFIFATPLSLSAQLSITREQEITLAESAAPAVVAREAAVYVFGKTGYERVRDGKNGFTCLVNRDSF